MCPVVYIGLYPWPPLFDRPELGRTFLGRRRLGDCIRKLPAPGKNNQGGARSDKLNCADAHQTGEWAEAIGCPSHGGHPNHGQRHDGGIEDAKNPGKQVLRRQLLKRRGNDRGNEA